MKAEETPQDNSQTYAGHRKIIYAQSSESAQYLPVQSSGWSVEEAATLEAVSEYERLASNAKEQVIQGSASPLMYHMYNCRMDLPLLAQVTGFFKWRVRRHFNPVIFQRLSPALLSRYAEALGITVEVLQSVEENQ